MKSLADLINLPRQSAKSDDKTHQSDDDAPKIKSDVPGVTKKIHKFKRANFNDAEITYIGYPKKQKVSDRCKRRYGVEVLFKDKTNGGAIKRKLVLFGKEGKESFIEHKSLIKRENCISKLKQTDNPLHPNFYELYLLNGKRETIDDNYIALINALELNV